MRIRASVQPGAGLSVCTYQPLTGWARQVSGSGRCQRTLQTRQPVSVTDGKLREHQGLPALLPTGNLST